jgi:hypothetical protein
MLSAMKNKLSVGLFGSSPELRQARELQQSLLADESIEIYEDVFFPLNFKQGDSMSMTQIDSAIKVIGSFTEYVKMREQLSSAQQTKLDSTANVSLSDASAVKDKLKTLIHLLSSISKVLFPSNEERQYIREDFAHLGVITCSNLQRFSDQQQEFITGLIVLYKNIRRLATQRNVMYTSPLFPYFPTLKAAVKDESSWVNVAPHNAGPIVLQSSSAIGKPQFQKSLGAVGSQNLFAGGASAPSAHSSQLGAAAAPVSPEARIKAIYQKHKNSLAKIRTNAKFCKTQPPARILVCCTANHTRSPVAEALLKAILLNCAGYTNINVASASVGLIVPKSQTSPAFRKTYSGDVKTHGYTIANVNSIAVVNQLVKFEPKEFKGADQTINTHHARDIENVLFPNQGYVFWPLILVMENKHKKTLDYVQEESSLGRKHLRARNVKLRIRKLPDAELLLAAPTAVSRDVFDPQGDFNKSRPSESLPLFFDMLDDILGLCIGWTQLIQKGIWNERVPESIGPSPVVANSPNARVGRAI